MWALLHSPLENTPLILLHVSSYIRGELPLMSCSHLKVYSSSIIIVPFPLNENESQIFIHVQTGRELPMVNLEKGAKFQFFSINHSNGQTFHSFHHVNQIVTTWKVESSTNNPLKIQTKVDKPNSDVATILTPIFQRYVVRATSNTCQEP